MPRKVQDLSKLDQRTLWFKSQVTFWSRYWRSWENRWQKIGAFLLSSGNEVEKFYFLRVHLRKWIESLTAEIILLAGARPLFRPNPTPNPGDRSLTFSWDGAPISPKKIEEQFYLLTTIHTLQLYQMAYRIPAAVIANLQLPVGSKFNREARPSILAYFTEASLGTIRMIPDSFTSWLNIPNDPFRSVGLASYMGYVLRGTNIKKYPKFQEALARLEAGPMRPNKWDEKLRQEEIRQTFQDMLPEKILEAIEIRIDTGDQFPGAKNFSDICKGPAFFFAKKVRSLVLKACKTTSLDLSRARPKDSDGAETMTGDDGVSFVLANKGREAESAARAIRDIMTAPEFLLTEGILTSELARFKFSAEQLALLIAKVLNPDLKKIEFPKLLGKKARNVNQMAAIIRKKALAAGLKPPAPRRNPRRKPLGD